MIFWRGGERRGEEGRGGDGKGRGGGGKGPWGGWGGGQGAIWVRVRGIWGTLTLNSKNQILPARGILMLGSGWFRVSAYIPQRFRG